MILVLSLVKMKNNKNRLFEIFEKVNGIKLIHVNKKPQSIINESFLSFDKKSSIIEDFISFADTELGLNGDLPEINKIDEEGAAKEERSFGGYSPDSKFINVVTKNRNLADVLRSLGHELVHHKQNIDGKLIDNSAGNTGSDIENEANSTAGILMRKYGKINPDIFE